LLFLVVRVQMQHQFTHISDPNHEDEVTPSGEAN